MTIRYAISFFINIVIFVITCVLVFTFFRKDGKWDLGRAKNAFRYFTTQSNVLCAISALCMCFFPDAVWAYYLKLAGTAAVLLTMFTVLLFLSRIYGIKPLLAGSDLFMHLLTPLMALLSLILFERRPIAFPAIFIGLIPVLLYAPLYLYHVVLAPEEKRWEDFYSLNTHGQWKKSYAMMLTGSIIICIALYFALNIARN